jgi:hypothetical protein
MVRKQLSCRYTPRELMWEYRYLSCTGCLAQEYNILFVGATRIRFENMQILSELIDMLESRINATLESFILERLDRTIAFCRLVGT